MTEALQETSPAARPSLWSPNAAANWSLVLTPAFGATLHAANWHALGRPDRARSNRMWVGATLVFLLANAATVFVPAAMDLSSITQLLSILLLVSWYLSQARAQVQFVEKELNNEYDKRSWGLPVLTGIGCIAAYFTVLIGLAPAPIAPERSATEVAEVLKPMLYRKWQTQGIHDIVIQEIQLEKQVTDHFAGSLDLMVEGERVSYHLDVKIEGEMIRWDISDTPLSKPGETLEAPESVAESLDLENPLWKDYLVFSQPLDGLPPACAASVLPGPRSPARLTRSSDADKRAFINTQNELVSQTAIQLEEAMPTTGALAIGDHLYVMGLAALKRKEMSRGLALWECAAIRYLQPQAAYKLAGLYRRGSQALGLPFTLDADPNKAYFWALTAFSIDFIEGQYSRIVENSLGMIDTLQMTYVENLNKEATEAAHDAFMTAVYGPQHKAGWAAAHRGPLLQPAAE